MPKYGDCPHLQTNLANCTCHNKNSCKHKLGGLCCDCIRYHKDKGQVPVCLRETVRKIVADFNGGRIPSWLKESDFTPNT